MEMDDTDLDVEKSECYVEFLNNIFFTEKFPNTDEGTKLLTENLARRPMINGMLWEQNQDVLYRYF